MDYIFVREIMYSIEIKALKYDKASPSLRKDIDKALEKLVYLIEEQDNYGIPFEKIFNNDTIKYDCLDNNFFTFKFSKGSIQLRLLYRFVRLQEDSVIELHDFHHKNRDDKSYIKEFERKASEFNE